MKKIALINDLSSFGKCSLVAAIPVISVMGLQACPLPTAILTAQSEFDHFFCEDLTGQMEHYTEHWKQMDVSFDGIYSGYLASSQQVEKVFQFLEQFQREDNFYLADPVMGDNGGTYQMYSTRFLQGMKKLTLRANVITPNLTELCLLADEDYEKLLKRRGDADYLDYLQEICRKLLVQADREQTVIVTGIIREQGGWDYVGNLAVSHKEKIYLETPYTGKSFSGTGDLFASVICGSLVKGLSLQQAMEKAAYFLQTAIEEATMENIPRTHGVHFEKYLSRLL